MRKRQYLNTIAILDTKSWTWIVPNINGIPPARRAFAVGGLLDDSHLTVAFGKGYLLLTKKNIYLPPFFFFLFKRWCIERLL